MDKVNIRYTTECTIIYANLSHKSGEMLKHIYYYSTFVLGCFTKSHLAEIITIYSYGL